MIDVVEGVGSVILQISWILYYVATSTAVPPRRIILIPITENYRFSYKYLKFQQSNQIQGLTYFLLLLCLE